jgi:hypothetical protein
MGGIVTQMETCLADEVCVESYVSWDSGQSKGPLPVPIWEWDEQMCICTLRVPKHCSRNSHAM